MQPQQKNLIVFFILSFLIFVGYSALQSYLNPIKPKPTPKKETDEEAKVNPWTDLPPQAIAAQVGLAVPMPAVPTIGPISQLAAQVEIARWTADKPHFWALKTNLPPPEPVVQKPKQAPRTIELGNDSSYNLHVKLTTRGAGVESIILNKFQEASSLGRPVFQTDDNGKHLKDERGKPIPEKLALVPGTDPEPDPSYALYNYPTPKASNPVNTLGNVVWHVKEEKVGRDLDEQKVVLETELPEQRIRITKTFTLKKFDYHIGLEVTFEALKDKVDFRYQLAGAHGLPIEGEWYTYTYRNSLIGLVDKGTVYRDLQDSRAIGVQMGGKDVWKGDSYIGYAGVATQYFASVIALDNKQEEGVDRRNTLEWARPTVEGPPNVQKPFLDDITTRVNSVALELKPGHPLTHKFLLYNGPVKVRLLGTLEGDQAVAPGDPEYTAQLVDLYENKLHLNTLTDYHSPSSMGWFSSKIGWTWAIIFFTNLIHNLLWFLHSFIGNYGLCIILVTIIVRGSMFPLSRRQALAGAKMQAKMAELAPEIKKLEEKHKNDAMALQQAKNELYMRKGINPLAMMGSCWMVLLQMPIFMGLYYALQESIHFRLAPFLWMENLAAPDMLKWWGENIPWISQPSAQGGLLYLGPFFNILPIIAVSLMLVQQKMLTPPPTDEQQAMQQKMMKWMMVLFGFMFYKVAAGLCLYFIASSLWGLAERKLLPKRQLATATAGAPTDTSTNGQRSRTSSRPGRGRNRRDEEEEGDGLVQRVKDWWEELVKQASKK
jgi:YidC/Oxa1 family membrane protein insertase